MTLRSAARCLAALLLVALSACSSAPEAAAAGDSAPSTTATVRAPSSVATPEWEREVTDRTGYPIEPIAFRTGGGLLSLLHGPSLANWMFAMADSARAAAGGPIPRAFSNAGPPLQMASDIAAVTSDGHSWFLDPRTGRVISEDVGHYLAIVAGLGARGTIRTACASGERAIAYLDVARPDTVFVRDLTSPAPPRALSLPPGFAAVHEVPWDSLRFGGSPDGPCVISSPRLRGLLVVTDSSVGALDDFIEPLPQADARQEAADAGVLGATSFPGGVAVLFGGRTEEAGRLVDFYDTTGAYLTTLRLPHPALRIAASHGRLYVLRQRHDPHDGIAGRVHLASYVLPARIRAQRAPAGVPTVIAPPAPGNRAMSPADSTPR
jgi:hypothetical protein